jgi:hypothetical protein
VAQLRWSAPGVAKEVIPQANLYPYVLLVTGSATLNAAEAALRTRLVNTGHSVVVRTGTASTTADASGKALVLLSSTVTAADVNTKYRTVVNPVLAWEPLLFDDLGLTGSGSFGTLTGRTQLAITAAGHPLAGGLSGTVTATSSAQTFSFGLPNANAVVAARPAGDATRAAIFGYERGAAMPGLAAPGRRVGFFLHDGTGAALTAAGSTLFDAAVRWATGR